MTTRLILVRHGRSHHQDAGRTGGPKGDGGLTELGREQVERAAARLVRWPHVADASVYSSTLPRAQESAQILAKAIGTDVVGEHRGLCSYHILDEHDGLSNDDVWAMGRRGGGMILFRPEHEGGDTYAQLALRAGEAYHELADRHYGETVVIATHNETIEASLVVLGYIPFRHRLNVSVSCGSITEWVTDDDTTKGGMADGGVFADWDLVRWNDTGHLEE